MANPIPRRDKIGTFGELLVQLRLLQYDVQAAPPLKDSGNDLIAIKGDCFRAIQVKTAKDSKTFSKPDEAKIYHILAVVDLVSEDVDLCLDASKIYLIPKKDVKDISNKVNRLEDKYKIGKEVIAWLF